MNNTSETIGHFEQLPDEILLDLFENYIRLVDTYVSFYSLNHRRINAILHSAYFHLDIPCKDIFHTPSFSHFASQIVSLRISMFCNDLDLSTLVNLRSLHIEKPSRSQLMFIRAELQPRLCYLSLSSCWYSLEELPKHLEKMIHSCPFEHLRFYILPNGQIIRFPRNHSPSSTLTLQQDNKHLLCN